MVGWDWRIVAVSFTCIWSRFAANIWILVKTLATFLVVFIVDRCNEMTIPSVTVASLKKYKNIVIGNPVAKVQLVRDELFVTTWVFRSSNSCSAHPWLVSLIDCLNPADAASSPSSKAAQDALRIEAAHVIASLSYGLSLIYLTVTGLLHR